MATGRDMKRIALALAGTSEAPHFDRTAFKVKRIYATLAADAKTANLKFTPDEQDSNACWRRRCSPRCRTPGASRAGRR
jgi:hypothetical protein